MISNTLVARACNPNEAKVVHPRRVRSAHDESTVSANILLSSMLPSNLRASNIGVLLKSRC